MRNKVTADRGQAGLDVAGLVPRDQEDHVRAAALAAAGRIDGHQLALLRGLGGEVPAAVRRCGRRPVRGPDAGAFAQPGIPEVILEPEWAVHVRSPLAAAQRLSQYGMAWSAELTRLASFSFPSQLR